MQVVLRDHDIRISRAWAASDALFMAVAEFSLLRPYSREIPIELTKRHLIIDPDLLQRGNLPEVGQNWDTMHERGRPSLLDKDVDYLERLTRVVQAAIDY